VTGVQTCALPIWLQRRPVSDQKIAVVLVIYRKIGDSMPKR